MFKPGRLFHEASASPDPDAIRSEKLFMPGDLEKSDHAACHVSSAKPKPKSNPRVVRGRLHVSFVLKLLALGLCLALTSLFRPVAQYAGLGDNAILRNGQACRDRENCNHDSESGRVTTDAAPPWSGEPVRAKPLEREGWKATCSSQVDDSRRACTNAIDGSGTKTYWQSKSGEHGASHWIMINLGKQQKVHSLAMQPSKSGADGGMPRVHSVQVAAEGESWVTVAGGMWRDDPKEQKFATFEPRLAQLVNLTIIDTTEDKDFVAISDIDIYGVDEIYPAPPEEGRWGVTIDFPLVPVTAFLNPKTHKLITLAAFKEDGFAADELKQTVSATWDPRTGKVERKLLTSTEHDMFCPGTSFDEKGSVIITGGDTPWAFSIYDSETDSWWTPKDDAGNLKSLTIGRGYQGQTYLSNGKTFMIGGGWSGTNVDKPGEIYDPQKESWQQLPNLRAEFMKMDVVLACDDDPTWDRKCVMDEWRQHHAWLFAWKNNSVFHAGPSKKMNWFFTEHPGGLHQDAGLRSDSPDAVCGVTSMYDAENGVVLTAGGSRNYHYWVNVDEKGMTRHRHESSAEAFEIKLGDAGEEVTTTKLKPMKYQRIFANGVILPTGETLVVGGQQNGEPFYDETWQPIPEIYSPYKKEWRVVARHSTPRGYHSWALLLPDASVVVGGAGLNDRRSGTNHYDAQIYHPAYLFEEDGHTPAKRPVISAIDNTQPYKVGSKITITTTDEVDAASLIRYSAATHALNNDLRRINMTLVDEATAAAAADDDDKKKEYSLQIPEDPGVALPGYWMLFVLRGEVPSVAETVQILA